MVVKSVWRPVTLEEHAESCRFVGWSGGVIVDDPRSRRCAERRIDATNLAPRHGTRNGV
jgi:hypothetical protein